MSDCSSEPYRVSLVIPHYLGDVLSRCVRSVVLNTDLSHVEVIVANDQPRDDGSIVRAIAILPSLRVVDVGGGRGFGAAVNAGIRAARSPLVFLLNNDAEVTPGWLPPMLDAAAEHPTAAVFQPKVRSLQEPGRFDYGGAAGGMIDALGYPYALGRRFGRIEIDHGQYDDPREIHWAVGGAMLLRKRITTEIGLFDEDFYMHMEEIDLCWRLRRAGWTIRSVPNSVVLHEGGHTLRPDSWAKVWLNHRNNWVLLIKNLSRAQLAWILPLRYFLVLPTIIYGVVKVNWRHPAAAVLAPMWIAWNVRAILNRRDRTSAAIAGVVRAPSPSRQVAEHAGSVATKENLKGSDASPIGISSQPTPGH
jgi:GT2 family glycosyltransferase